MSWKGSVHFWSCGPLEIHVFVHALDPKQRRFYEVGWGRHTLQAWPPPSVLDHRNEWTAETREDLLRLAAWVAKRLRNHDHTPRGG